MSKNPLDAVLTLFNKFSLQQKIVIGGAVVLTFVLLSAVAFFLNEPSYSVLYSNLSTDDASKIVDYLNNQKIPYKIDDGGKTIEVPKEKVYESRLSLAGKGIPSAGIVGYEIFDKNTMGMSDFMQKLNYQRALEGELARTIMEIDGVEGARVHIVIPKKSVFKDEEKLPTASVVLKLANSYMVSKANVSAIVNLVSSSVEGLKPGNVTLIDTRGQILSKEYDDNPIASSSAKQYEIKQSIENYLASKAQKMLDNILGYGNAMVQVNADIDFSQVEKTMNIYDPNGQVTVSEQTIKTENNGKNSGDSTAQVSQNTTTNYEISNTIQKVVEAAGNIKRLSVATVINDIPKDVKKGNKTEVVYEPRAPEQMKKLEEIVKDAVGYNDQRKDNFSIVNISFETKPVDNIDTVKPSFIDNYKDYTDIILVIVGIIGAIFILKSLLGKLKNQKIYLGDVQSDNVSGYIESSKPTSLRGKGGSGKQKLPPDRKRQIIPLGDIEDEISDEAVRKKTQQDKISNYVAKNPVDAAKLINAWLHEDEMS